MACVCVQTETEGIICGFCTVAYTDSFLPGSVWIQRGLSERVRSGKRDMFFISRVS